MNGETNKKTAKNIDFEMEIQQVIHSQPWKECTMSKNTQTRFDKTFGDLMGIYNTLLGSDMKTLTDIPGLKGKNDDVILAMTI